MQENKLFKSGFVGILGRSNVGKSTLMNAIVGEKVAIVSDKAQTTRNAIRGILTTPEYQVVFVDTPGLHKARTRLGQYMVQAARQAVQGVDMALAVFDASEHFGYGDQGVMDTLVREDIPIIAVLNKIDKVDKQELLGWMERLGSYEQVKEILPISARKRQGIDTVLPAILKLLPQGEMLYPEEYYTDQSQRQIVAETIREKALNQLRQEIPHGIGVEILQMEADDQGKYTISANILCERDSHKGIIIGKQGAMLKTIGTHARREIRAMLGGPVFLELWVKVKEDWRDSPAVMRDLGYDRRMLDE